VSVEKFKINCDCWARTKLVNRIRTFAIMKL